MNITFNLNDEIISRDIDPSMRLIDFLRDNLGITSIKEGCSEGECGACTIIFNGRAVTSCTMFAGQINGGSILTLEGLSKHGELDKIQKSFIENGAIQCGFCTSGMILSVKALLMKNPKPTLDEIKEAIAGNLCRCTGYNKIIKAVQDII